MQNKLIAAVLVLMSAGFAWQTFADKEGDACRQDCEALADKCIKDNIKSETAADLKLARKYCMEQHIRCEQKCREAEIDRE